MKKYLAIAALATACMAPAAAHAETASMICTGPTGKEYTATYNGKTVKLTGSGKTGTFIATDDYYDLITTKPNKEGVYLNAFFFRHTHTAGVNYFTKKSKKAFQQDDCRMVKGRTKGQAKSDNEIAAAALAAPAKSKLFKIERFFETEGGNSKAILSVNVPGGARYVEGQCAFKDRGGNVLDVSSVIALHSGYETVFGPSAATDISCNLAARH